MKSPDTLPNHTPAKRLYRVLEHAMLSNRIGICLVKRGKQYQVYVATRPNVNMPVYFYEYDSQNPFSKLVRSTKNRERAEFTFTKRILLGE